MNDLYKKLKSADPHDKYIVWALVIACASVICSILISSELIMIFGSDRSRRILVYAAISVVFSFLTAAALISLAYKGWMVFKAPDNFTYDWRHALLSKQEPSARPDISLLLIDNNSLVEHPFIVPLNNKLLLRLLLELDGFGAKVIGLDMVIDRSTDLDQELLQAIKLINSNIVFAEIDKRSEIPENLLARHHQIINKLKSLSPKVSTGHPYFEQNKRAWTIPDQTIRLRAPDTSLPGLVKKSFAESLVLASGRSLPEFKDRGHISWLQPFTEDGSSVFSELHVPAHKIEDLQQRLLPETWRKVFEGKIVIVGTAFGQRDGLLTPLSIIRGERVPEAWVHANIAAQFIDGRKLEPFSINVESIVVTVLTCIGFWMGRVYRAKDYEPYVYFGGGLALIAIGVALFSQFGLLIPSDTIFLGSIIGITVGHYSGWLQPVEADIANAQATLTRQDDVPSI